MAQLRLPPVRRALPELRYVRAPEPLVFPEDAQRPESKTHLVLRTFLFRLLRFALGPPTASAPSSSSTGTRPTRRSPSPPT